MDNGPSEDVVRQLRSQTLRQNMRVEVENVKTGVREFATVDTTNRFMFTVHLEAKELYSGFITFTYNGWSVNRSFFVHRVL